MSPRQKKPSADYADEAGRWLAFARGDLESATALLATQTPNRNVGYLAQQAAEKALKAVILLDNAPFEMTHDLTAVAAQLHADFPVPVGYRRSRLAGRPRDLGSLSRRGRHDHR